jgi:CubicO group peptidase (beta-lactamase class C family)
LKTILLCCLLSFLLIGCNTNSREKVAADDSLQYYPSTPVKMDRDEFRHYVRVISHYIDTMLLNKGFNGAVLFAKNGNIIYEKYVGKVDLRKEDSITASTSFHVASSSKPLTATAILRLVQENRLSLDDSLQKFFPGFPYKGITIKMLLNHRSGLPNYLYFMSNLKWGIGPDKKWNKQFATNQDVIKMMFEKKPDRTGSPNTRFNYSNTNFILLATIIEKVTGNTFPDHMRETIFQPLGMNDSYIFTLADTLRATPTFTHNNTFWEYDFVDLTYGDKNLYTTPRDMLKFDQALYYDSLLSPALLDSSNTPYSMEKPSIHNYGLGWRLQMLPNGKKIIYHFGRWHGSNAAFVRLLDEKVTILIFGNRFNRAIYDAAQQSYKIFGDYSPGKESDPDEIDSIKTELLNKDAKNKKE